MTEVHIRCTHSDENMNKLAKWLVANTFCDIICFEVGKKEEKKTFPRSSENKFHNLNSPTTNS